MFAIEARGLTKYYGKSRGIVGVNLEVDEGEVFGFIGPNGAGKTTTIRLLLNLIFPTSGEARVFGLDCVNDSKEIRKNTGYLPAEVNYYGEMTVRSLLEYSGSFYEKDCRERARRLAEELELDLDVKIENLSMGNKKKVGIVQALMHEPKLLILDEPTSGLDPLMQNRFYSLLLDENKRGTTIFFSSHVLTEVQKLCHRVAIIKDGSILKLEDMDSLRRRHLRRIRLAFASDEASLPDIPGMLDVRKENGSLRFMFEGDLQALLSALTRLPLVDVIIEEPTLEEVFMHYYEEGDK
jgi:ABC-2 type transport system ATP-binding protein